LPCCIKLIIFKVLELREKLSEQQNINENNTELRLTLEADIDKAALKAQKQINELATKISTLERKLDDDKQWRKTKETEDLRRLVS